MKNSFLVRCKIRWIRTCLWCIFGAILFFPSIEFYRADGNNLFTVFLNGVEVGRVASEAKAEKCIMEARKSLAKASSDLLFLSTDLSLEGQSVLFGSVDAEKDVVENMMNVLQKEEQNATTPAYTVKIKEFTVSLGSMDDVKTLLNKAIGKYDNTGTYKVELIQDTSREFNVLTTKVYSEVEAKAEEEKEIKEHSGASNLPQAGFFAAISDIVASVNVEEEKDLSAYNRGIIEMDFDNPVEIVETYMPKERLSDLTMAIERVTKDQETNKIYEVVPGDTLGEIAETHNMKIADLVAMNEILESENSMIRVGDELIISVPEPELSVVRKEEQYIEEDYDAEIEYVDNDSWYTTEKVTLQQPSAGHRKAVAIISYRNDSRVETEIVKEDVDIQAIPKIVERGTKIPPTYIKPLSGGRMSSGFGKRRAPKRGASTNHQGIDWAVPTGTAIMASCGGTVTKAGWGSGYGYVIYIKHPDGKETRYGHLSKILVSAGQSVSQGQKIALSGNTGNSTGPHLHFEIRINGAGVNPLNYLN